MTEPTGTAEDLREALWAIRAAQPSTVEGEAQLRDNYRRLVAAAWRQGEDRWIYDAWGELVDRHHPELRRGFFLDQWDYLGDVLRKPRGEARPLGCELRVEVLEAFLGLRIAEFARILDTERMASPTAWRREIGGLLVEAKRRVADGAETAAERCVLTAHSLVQLHNRYWRRGDGSDTGWEHQAREAFKGQLGAFEAAGKGLRAALYDPAEMLRPGADLEDAEPWVSLLCYLTLHTGDPLEPGSFEAFTGSLAQATGNKPEAVARLIRHWVARSPSGYLRFLFTRRLGGHFDRTPPAPAPSRIAFHGCDHWILLAGGRQVGKSSLLFASETAVENFLLESATGQPEQVDRLRDIWQQGVPPASRDRWKTQGIELRARIRRPLCQFNLYDIPGEELEGGIKEGGSVEQILKGFSPSVLLLLFDLTRETAAQAVAYRKLLEMVAKRAAGGPGPSIYFVFNKVDRLLADLGEQKDADPNRIAELARALDGGGDCAPSDLRLGPATVWERGELRRLVLTREACCAEPLVQQRLLADLQSLEGLLDICRARGLRDVTLAYTSCLYRPEADYPGVAALWGDLVERTAASTRQSRREYFEQEVAAELVRELERADGFPVRAALEIPAGLVLDRSDFTDALNRSTADTARLRGRLQTGSVAPAEVGEQDVENDNRSGIYARLADLFGDDSGLVTLLGRVRTYEAALGQAREDCRRAVGAVLDELGIPAAVSVGELDGQRSRQDLGHRAGSNGTAPPPVIEGVADKLAALEGAVGDLLDPPEPWRRYLADDLTALRRRLEGFAQTGPGVCYEEPPYDLRQGAETTLCSFRDRQPTMAESQLLDRDGGGSLLDVAVELEPGDVALFVEWLKNHSPRYALASFRPFEKDAYKRAAVVTTASRRRRIESEHLVPQLENLVRWAAELRAAVGGSEVRRAVVAEYLWQVLEGWGVFVDRLQPEGPDGLTAAREALAAVREFYSRPSSLIQRSGETAREDGLRQAASGVFSTPLRDDPSRDQVRAFGRELEMIATLTGYLKNLEPALDRSPLSFRGPTPTRVDRHRKYLAGYVDERQALLVAQRIEYLRASEWLPPDGAGFLDAADGILAGDRGGFAFPFDEPRAQQAAETLLAGVRSLHPNGSPTESNP